MRLKYPHISVGALASSAPILQFEDIVPQTIFYDIVSNDFKVRRASYWFHFLFWIKGTVTLVFLCVQRESLSCFQTIKDSWNELDEQGNVQDGLLKLSKMFHLCQ
jgi:lysosomal Pro-X carboxypeptidase